MVAATICARNLLLPWVSGGASTGTFGTAGLAVVGKIAFRRVRTNDV